MKKEHTFPLPASEKRSFFQKKCTSASPLCLLKLPVCQNLQSEPLELFTNGFVVDTFQSAASVIMYSIHMF